MTKDEAIERLKTQQTCSDEEAAHVSADNILCELLESLGYSDVVREWKKVKKWFA